MPGTEANLEFTRTYNAAYGANEKTNSKTLGQMWQPSAPMEAEYAEEAWQKLLVRSEPAVPAKYEQCSWTYNEATEGFEESCVQCTAGTCSEPCEYEDEETGAGCQRWMTEAEIPEQNWVEVLDNEGVGIPFERTGGTSGSYTYAPPEEAKEYKLVESEGHFTLTESSGTSTKFSQNSETPTEYTPSAITFPGTSKTAQLKYGVDENHKMKLMMEVGPAPTGVTCETESGEGHPYYAPTTEGCRSLEFNYSSFKVENEEAFRERLDKIIYYDSTGSGEEHVVAKYSYDDVTGNLIAEWDPRIEPEVLKERYDYYSDEDARLTRLTPPGTEPWEFEYYPAGSGGAYEAKLKSVKRNSLLSSPEPEIARTTIAYGVPISGEGAPYGLGPSAIAQWGQTDYPVNATAVFPPTEVPGEEPSDYDQATIHYLDPDGHEVNTASPSPPGVEGESITTTETDAHGNVVRELSAQNRLRALASEDPAERAHQLDTHSEYSADGTEMLQSWGPLHQVRRADNGETVEARAHTKLEYEDPTPAEGEAPYDLPTKETTGASIPGQESDIETRVNETNYEWKLRKPIEEIVDPEGLDLITKTVYNEAGQVVQERQPSNPKGGGAGTTKTAYWTAGKNSEDESCSHNAAWAGLPCEIYPAAEPSHVEAVPELPSTHFKEYSPLDQPEKIEDGRTTTMTYDNAGRLLTTHQLYGGIAVPKIETIYNKDTGAPESQLFLCESECEGFDSQEVKTEYDALGRPVKYLDADGNESKVEYDLLGQPAYVSDGKGAQEFSYDEASGLPTEMTDSAAGTFKALYNADGQMTEQLLPNGLAQKVSYGPEGSATSLQYVKETGCSSACNWLSFAREDSIQGQVQREVSTLGEDQYSYDKDGRLTLARETPAGEGCTSRAYTYDRDSNRLSKAIYKPGSGGGCNTKTASSEQTYSYDAADRLTSGGIEYEGLGRITSLPARYSEESGEPSWRIGGKTLSELKLESASFVSQGELVLNMPHFLVELKCELYSHGKLSGAESIEEHFELYGCAFYNERESSEHEELSLCGEVKASMTEYDGSPDGMEIEVEPEEAACIGLKLPMFVSAFRHKYTNEEAREIPVQTKGSASLWGNKVIISANSTWELDGAQTGEKLSFAAADANPKGGEIATSYYVNDLTHSQTQGEITNTYNLDTSLRERERIREGGSEEGVQIYHYAGATDSPAWTESIKEGKTSWTRNIRALGGSIGATESDEGEVTLELADMHGNMVATVAEDPETKELLDTQRFDEFGNPQQSGFLKGGSAEYGWLGAKGRRTQLPSGVIQMGLRSYVPALGRFLTPDPMKGGSANAYDYANQDPVNNFDLTGEKYCSRVHGAEVCGRNGRQLGKRIKASRRRFRHERRVAARVSHGQRTIILQYNPKGATSSSLRSVLEDAANTVIDTVGGGTKKMVGNVMKISLTGPEYKAASKAFSVADAWSPSRIVQYWQCGTWLGGGKGDCDPFEIATGIETESAR